MDQVSLGIPDLFTFDIFGTVVDWRAGLLEALLERGYAIDENRFDKVIDLQARLEQGGYRSYTEITAESLATVVGLHANEAQSIAKNVGAWPLFADSRDGLRRLSHLAPCVAMTNSDKDHGAAVERSLGYRLAGWISAEDVRCYKPSIQFWGAVAARRGVAFGPGWWHVSAYADYDLETAARLGLTTVFIERPHSRWGRSTIRARDLISLAQRLGV